MTLRLGIPVSILADMTVAAHICAEVLEQALQAAEPRSILAIGPDTEKIFTPFVREHPRTTLNTLGSDASTHELSALGTHDLALVANTLERMPEKPAGALLAALRDLYARRLYVLLPLNDEAPEPVSHWNTQKMIALGFTRTARYRNEAGEIALFRYDLYDYKTTPDWLNSRYWANPELWDKYRW